MTELLKSMNVYGLEDVNQFCQDILDEFYDEYECSNTYKSLHKEYQDIKNWVFYIMLLREWPTKDFGTFIDYYQHFFFTFQQLKNPYECRNIREETRKE